MSLVVHTEGSFSVFHFFGVVYGTSWQPLLACYGLFQVVALFTNDNVTECFDLQIYYKSISCRFYHKGVRYEVGQLKVGQVF